MPIFLGKLSSKEGVSLRMENKPKQEEIGRKVFWDWDSLYVGQNKVEQWKGKKKKQQHSTDRSWPTMQMQLPRHMVMLKPAKPLSTKYC